MDTDADDHSIGFARLKHLGRESEQALDDHSTIHPCEVHHATMWHGLSTATVIRFVRVDREQIHITLKLISRDRYSQPTSSPTTLSCQST